MHNGQGTDRSGQGAGQASRSADGDLIAIQALTFIGRDARQAQRFFDISGLDAGNLRQSAADPTFLLGVLDYLVSDEPLLLAFAESIASPAEAIVRAHDAMRRGAKGA
jgi:hypothetical protein